MRKNVLLAPALLAACSTAPAALPVVTARRQATPASKARPKPLRRPGAGDATGKAIIVGDPCRRAPLGAARRHADDGFSRRPRHRLAGRRQQDHQDPLRLGRFADHPRFHQGAPDGRQRQSRALGDGEAVDRFDRPLGGPVIAVQPLGHEAQRVIGNMQPAVGEEQLDQRPEQADRRGARCAPPASPPAGS